MALWALTDNLAGAPKWLTPTFTFDAAGVVTAGDDDTIELTDHGINDLDQVTLVNGSGGNLATAGVYVASVSATGVIKLYTGANLGVARTNAINSGDTGRVDLTVQGTGHSLQVTPADVFFIDSTEAQVTDNREIGFHVPGWYRYATRTTSDGATRHDVELLCAVSVGGSAVGDTGDDGVTGDTAVEDATVVDS